LAVWLETSVCFLHDCHIMATVVLLLAAGGGEELLFRVCEESADDAVVEW